MIIVDDALLRRELEGKPMRGAVDATFRVGRQTLQMARALAR